MRLYFPLAKRGQFSLLFCTIFGGDKRASCCDVSVLCTNHQRFGEWVRRLTIAKMMCKALLLLMSALGIAWPEIELTVEQVNTPFVHILKTPTTARQSRCLRRKLLSGHDSLLGGAVVADVEGRPAQLRNAHLHCLRQGNVQVK